MTTHEALEAEIDACRRNCDDPVLSVGAQRDDGTYYRNLDDGHLSKRYAGDVEPPRFGWRVKWKDLDWLDPQTQAVALSTNCAACIRSPRCSVLTDISVAKRRHVVGIRLRPFALRCKLSLVAVYQPVVGDASLPDNACHWEINVMDGDHEELLLAIQVAFGELDKHDPRWPDWPKKKLPAKEHLGEAEALADAIASVIEIHRNVGVQTPASPPAALPSY